MVLLLLHSSAFQKSLPKESPSACHCNAFISRPTKSIVMCRKASMMHQYSRSKLMLTWKPESSNLSRDDFCKYVFFEATVIGITGKRFWWNDMECSDLMTACTDTKQTVPEHWHGCLIDLSELLVLFEVCSVLFWLVNLNLLCSWTSTGGAWCKHCHGSIFKISTHWLNGWLECAVVLCKTGVPAFCNTVAIRHLGQCCSIL